MSLINNLVLFAKTPRIGKVKTRLAKDIGIFAATKFYRSTVKILLHRLLRDPRWQLYIAVTPDLDAYTHTLWPAHVPLIPQGSGDLGKRMVRVITSLPLGPVVVVGSDIPNLEAGHVAMAFYALRRSDTVFGPATDGGYWLIGLKRRKLLKGLFTSVRWSSQYALVDTLENISHSASVSILETLDDIDVQMC